MIYCRLFSVLVCLLFLLLLSSSLGLILFFWRSQVVGCWLLVWQKKGVAFWDRVAGVEVLLYLQHQRSSKGEKKRKIRESARGGTGRRQCGRGKKSSAAVLEAQSAALFNTFWHCRLSKSLIRRHGVLHPSQRHGGGTGHGHGHRCTRRGSGGLQQGRSEGKQPTSRVLEPAWRVE